ncbi:tetratricopeptide repeat protein [Fluviicola chungangensis]|uniref:Tetratricopeptide repeat protein n=1 Tax=Fluviicola chungangensis TaxID=2597671 RepID=A0A556MGK4_9FLAO|nr:tetratricopeptide repeat protein [Fluviicola chungangensis]TSJ39018.1 tetratricopeptide repeat protein [Fluviicola chungangensis]
MKNKDHISRNAFEKLIHTFSQEDTNEQLSDFDRDALEGWQQSNVPFSKMKQLDQKMNFPKVNFTPYILSLSVVAILALTFFFLSRTAESSQTREPVLVKFENTDINIPEEIDTLEVIPQKDQITVSEIKTSQNEIKNLPADEKKEELTNIPFPELVLEPLPPVIEQKPVTVSKQKVAKEIYLQDLKAIDYSQYRIKPTVQIEQIILTGIPADRENEDDLVSEEPQVKLVNIPYMDYLEKSLSYTNRGKWKLALSRFNEIIKNYPDDVNARFYAGWCYYNLGQYNEACINFSACLQLEFSNFNDEAEWYLAESRLANGDKNSARELFVKIRNQKGFYSKQAEKVLKTWK